MPPMSPPPRKRGPGRFLWPIGTGILGLVIGLASHGSSGTSTQTTVTAVTAGAITVTSSAPAPKPAAAPAPAAQATIDGDGTYIVGTDVKAGTYRSAKPSSGNCYWARLKGDDPADIIANNNSAGPSVVTIKSTDKEFTTQGCETWTKVK